MVTESKTRLKSAGYSANNKITTQTCLQSNTDKYILKTLEKLEYFQFLATVFSGSAFFNLFLLILFLLPWATEKPEWNYWQHQLAEDGNRRLHYA